MPPHPAAAGSLLIVTQLAAERAAGFIPKQPPSFLQALLPPGATTSPSYATVLHLTDRNQSNWAGSNLSDKDYIPPPCRVPGRLQGSVFWTVFFCCRREASSVPAGPRGSPPAEGRLQFTSETPSCRRMLLKTDKDVGRDLVRERPAGQRAAGQRWQWTGGPALPFAVTAPTELTTAQKTRLANSPHRCRPPRRRHGLFPMTDVGRAGRPASRAVAAHCSPPAGPAAADSGGVTFR